MTGLPGEEPPLHALLIGIDAYSGGISLDGCVNDIDAIQRVLVDKLNVAIDRIRRLAAPRFGTVHPTEVPSMPPTLENIRREFERLGDNRVVASGDRVFIYYSGHGALCPIQEPLGRIYAREALLPSDHVYLAERRFLFDWELNGLLARIARCTTSITFVLDCCSAAGATRALFDTRRGSRVRFVRIAEPLVLTKDESGPGPGSHGLAHNLAGSVRDCLVVAACLDDERARESDGEDGAPAHGELTRALVRQLGPLSKEELQSLRWGRIWSGLLDDVTKQNPAQHPWLSSDFSRLVFGGPPVQSDIGYRVEREGNRYRIGAGTLSGVTEEAQIAVYGSEPLEFPPIGSSADLGSRVALLRVTAASRSSAEAALVTLHQPWPSVTRGRLVKAGRGSRLVVAIPPGDDKLTAALATSPVVRLASPGEKEDLTLVRLPDGGLALTDDVFGAGEAPDEPVLCVIPRSKLDRLREVVEHYHAYSAPIRMARRCTDLPGLLRVALLDCNGANGMTSEAAQHPALPEVSPGRLAPYELKAASPGKKGDLVCFRVENCADTVLRVALFSCQADGSVALVGEKSIPGQGGHLFWAGETLGRPFEARLDGDTRLSVDRIVAIGTTNVGVSLQYLSVDKTFARVLNRSRDLAGARSAAARGAPGNVEQWTAATTAIRVIV